MTIKNIHGIGVALAIGALALAAPALARDAVRLPAGAGIFYPAEVERLKAAVDVYLSEAETPRASGKLVACIAPEGGYATCGKVMAAAFKDLKAGEYDRVIVMTPAHFTSFDGLSAPTVETFLMPQGPIPVDGPAVRDLSRNSLIALRSVVYRKSAYTDMDVRRVALHEREHGYELPLPFLQTQLGSFKLIPLVVGKLRDDKGGLDEDKIEKAAATIRDAMTPRTLLVLCANLTQYGPQYGYHPFQDDVPGNIMRLDLELLNILQSGSLRSLNAYLDETGNRFEGVDAVALFMRIVPRNALGLLLDYDTSGRINDKPTLSVSYAAVGYFLGSAPPTAFTSEPAMSISTTAPPQQTTPERAHASSQPMGGRIPGKPAS